MASPLHGPSVGQEIDCYFCDLPFVADQVPFGHGDRYLLRRFLKPGGMAYVFETFDTALRRRVALKIPIHVTNADDAFSKQSRERFRNEIRALTYLSHPNINSIADSGEWKERPYFTMPYLVGGTLGERLARAPHAAVDTVAGWIRTVARAMEYAHEIGVYHRDLKPANLMFDSQGSEERLLVTDFGLALIHQDTRITEIGTRLGTPCYMSPEQMAGKTELHGARSDIYSLGVIFYEALTGRLPFPQVGEALRVAVLRNDPPRPATLRPDIDPRLEQICLTAMSRSPRQRYQSMGELARSIEGYLRRTGVPAIPGARADVARPLPHVTQRGLHQIAMSQVPAGTFLLGSRDAEDERPPRTVRFPSPFLMGVYPVTQSLYRTVIGSLPLSRFNGKDQHPVDSVSWFDAIHFCNRLSISDELRPFYEIQRNGTVKPIGGSGYRLPTEAEWEYSCRAGSKSVYFFGDDASRLSEFAWFEVNSGQATHPVGERAANGYALFDMLGNVWEWCWDWYGPYPTATPGAPEDEINPTGPRRGEERILRGGCFQASARHLRSTQRHGFDPELGVYYIGFRLARSLG
jgi:formylglycine-generating enzyme required for sulfatase activity